jgi:hypothetical protein
MSTTQNYDNDCKLIKENDEDYLIEMINTKHIFGIEKNQYDLVFLKKLFKLLIEDIIDEEDTDTNYIKQIGNYYKGKEDFENMKKYYLIAIEKGEITERKAIDNLINTMEQYANFGFYKIEEKLKDNPNFFYKNTGFLDVILELTKANNNPESEIIEDL